MSKPAFNQIQELIAQLDRISREAQELREKIAILIEQRRASPERRQVSLQFSERAEVHDSTTPPVRRLRK